MPKTVPLVLHILYNTPVENISDAQIASQIKSLNEDFSRTNSDKSQTPDAFKSVAVDTGIKFCLVKTIRKKTGVAVFDKDDAMKSDSTGGSSPLDVTKYLNVWVCNLGDRLLGYGEIPNTQASPTYGVVVNFGAFGTIGTARAPYNKGRTLTHELAHSLGVLHTFSESTISCTKTDHCPDIPSQSSPSSGCPSFPKLDNCAAKAPGVMFMNYMDYSNDSCMNVFTSDQAKRMNAVLSIAPYKGLSETGCTKLDSVGEPPIDNEPINQTPKTMNNQTIAIVISIVILLLIWTRKNWSATTKLIYTVIYGVVGYFIYSKVINKY